MARIDFEEVTKELDLEFLFERESLPYKLGRGVSGMQINAKHCPECGDSRHRVYLNAETGAGNCFKCNASFSKVKFVKAHFGVEWKDLGPILTEIMRDQGWRPKRMDTAAVVVDQVKLPYSHPMPTENGEYLVYLESRGIQPELAKYFHLRWCEYGWWQFTDEKGQKADQKFDNRLIIPVFDLDGELVTFQGRDLTNKSDRKYLFPKGLPGTGRFLLNAQNVHLTKEIVMGEGAFDVMAIKIALDEDVSLRHVVPVGTFGKHLSYGSTDGNDQLGRLLKIKSMGVKMVTIMWDGEQKALIAALNACKLITGIGMTARIALLPPDKDPNEVPAQVVRQAYYGAHTYTSKLDITWRLKNPYAPQHVGKFFPVSGD